MKIRMVEERTGGRWDGRAWPPRGGEIYVDDEEGAAICAAGWAVPVPEDDVEVPEAAAALLEEKRAAPESPAEAPEPPADGKPPQNAPKAAWVQWAARSGAPAVDLESMSKADLISRYG